MIGERFDRLIVIARGADHITPGGTYKRQWICRCDCGEERVIRQGHLRNGHTKSCGCLSRELVAQGRRTHGKINSPEYYSWSGMVQRCSNPNNHAWDYYGGRGITVCKHWKDSFENFLNDMGERPEGLTLDRINNNGNYEPSNCRWATKKEQSNNQRARKAG